MATPLSNISKTDFFLSNSGMATFLKQTKMKQSYHSPNVIELGQANLAKLSNILDHSKQMNDSQFNQYRQLLLLQHQVRYLYSDILWFIKHLVLYGNIIRLQIIFVSLQINSNHNPLTCNYPKKCCCCAYLQSMSLFTATFIDKKFF